MYSKEVCTTHWYLTAYKTIRKIAFILVFCIFAAGTAFAQNNIEAMRFLTINALLEYGHMLYDRGDFNGASAVFNRVLTYDGNQPQALEYLKDMGYAPVASPSGALQQAVDVSDTQSLKQAVEAKKRVIAQLQAQIKQMRADIASQSAEGV